MCAKWATAVVAVILVASSTCAFAQELPKRVAQMYDGWSKEEPKLVWQVLNPEIREETDFETYATELKKSFADSKLKSFHLREVTQVTPTLVQVDADLVVFVPSLNRQFARLQTTRWILHKPDNQWYFAGGQRVK